MKKITILVFLTFTVSLFGQMKEYKKATNLYNDKKFSEANVILEKLINKEYGELEQEMAFYVLYMNAGCYYNLNDFKIAYTKYEELIVFVKNSVNLFTTPSGKEEQIASLEKFKDDFKSKIPKGENTSIQSESSVTANSGSNEIITNANSDNKTVTLTVSGTGKTIEEARLNALRSAIEQAFGAFISSKTEILNDNLVKDEIVSVTNGNIQKFDIISQVEIPDNGYAITLSATVSIDKLTSFAESKGVVVEFKGGMFGLKVKLQKLNEKNELNACINILSVVHELLQNGYDYILDTEEPKLFKDTKYTLKFKVTAKPNSNFNKAMDYLNSSLSNLKMSENEIQEYANLNKKIYQYENYYLRNEMSFNTLKNIHLYKNYYLGNFNLIINNDKKISGPDLGGSFNNYNWQSGFKTFTFPSFMFHNSDYFDGNFMGYSGSGMGYYDKETYNIHSNEFIWEQLFEISDIENFSSISIVGKGVNSKVKQGGFVIYEDDKTLILAAPYCIKWDKELSFKPINTSNKIFEGKKNMNLLKDNQSNNTLYDLVLKHNFQNNTEWHIPSLEELKLYVKNIYSTHTRGNRSIYISSTFFSPYDLMENVRIACFSYNDRQYSFLFKENQKYGIPFNSFDSFEIFDSSFEEIWFRNFFRYSTESEKAVIPLIKYINK
jgi:hypothetical protein